AVVLAESDVAINQSGVEGRKVARAQISFAEQSIHRTCANRCQEHTFRVHPPIALLCTARADENWPWRSKCDQLVRINRQIVLGQRPVILKKLPCHPILLSARDVPDLLAIISRERLSTAAARR